MNLEPLSITEELQKFAKHLYPKKNKHIIFSGIFGIGKTYFINPTWLSIKISSMKSGVSKISGTLHIF